MGVFDIVIVVVLVIVILWIISINRDNGWQDGRIDDHHQRLENLERKVEDRFGWRGDR